MHFIMNNEIECDGGYCIGGGLVCECEMMGESVLTNGEEAHQGPAASFKPLLAVPGGRMRS